MNEEEKKKTFFFFELVVIPVDLTCPQTSKQKKVQKTGFCSLRSHRDGMVHFESWKKISFINQTYFIDSTYQDEKSCNTKTKLFTYQSFQNVLSFPLLQAAQVCIYSDAIFHSSTIQEKRQYFQKAVFSSSFTLRLSLEWKSFIKLYSVLYIVYTFFV